MVSSVPPISSADLKQLRIFKSVVEHNGFSAAQDELGLSRSTISAQMSALETRLGFKLCNRGRSGFTLTEQGQHIFEEAIKCFAALDNFSSEIGAMRGRLTGELHVGVLDACIENPACALHEAIAIFNKRAPDVHLYITLITPNQTANAFLKRQVDIAIVSNQPINAPVQLEQIFKEQQYLYCGKGHPLFDAPVEKLTLENISQQPYVRRGYTNSSAVTALFNQPPAATSSSMECNTHLVLSGRYISFLPSHYARQWVEEGRMRALRPDLINFTVGFCVAHFQPSALSPLALAFRESLMEAQSNHKS
ncbi:LysR family transcriptional regulator [uncultured Cohaesibacter sp.]|uniref:LysR family transcriptional regulator n=1 Tax=uncultured Cohaesibacter sp. TaxID=1002546 RepID=UPI0029C93C35|nr:LysR family transcriptional regulator [uncultured Cohaesibacter sp.]